MQTILETEPAERDVRAADASLESKVVEALWKLGVDYEKWGESGASKAVDRLVASLEDGEIEWDYEGASDLLHVHTAVVHVLYEDNGQLLELRERYKKFRNGYIHYPRDFSGSVSEKIKYRKETAFGAAVRGLAEELGPANKGFLDSRNCSFYSLTAQEEETEPRSSKSYPGLYSVYHRKIFKCRIADALYQEEYLLDEPDKKTYFYWLPV